MAQTYLSQSDPKKIAKAVRIKKAVVIGIVVALVMFMCSLLITMTDAHVNYDIDHTYEIIETSYDFNE